MADVDVAALLRQVPQTDPSADLSAVSLTSEDAFVLSRIDGHTPAGLIADMVALPVEQIVDILRKLEQSGAIRWEGHVANGDRAPPDDGRRPASSSPGRPHDEPGRSRGKLDPALEVALAEPGELSRAERLSILAIERDLLHRSYWDVLGLTGEPSSADVKRAYFEASKRFHPDRFYGRELGSFAARLDRVFRGIKEAYDVLGNPARRAEYEAEHPPPSAERKGLDELLKPRLTIRKRRSQPPKGANGAEPIDEERRNRLEQRRAEILARRSNQRLAPARNQSVRAKAMFEAGLDKLKAKDVVGAAADFKLAMTYAPQNEHYVRNFQEANAAALELRCRELIEPTDLDIATGRFGQAAQAFARASDLLPDRIAYARRAAELFAKADDRVRAKTYAQRAVACAPRRPDVRIMLARLLEEEGDLEGALSHYEVAASLDKANGDVKKAVKRLSKKLT